MDLFSPRINQHFEEASGRLQSQVWRRREPEELRLGDANNTAKGSGGRSLGNRVQAKEWDNLGGKSKPGVAFMSHICIQCEVHIWCIQQILYNRFSEDMAEVISKGFTKETFSPIFYLLPTFLIHCLL